MAHRGRPKVIEDSRVVSVRVPNYVYEKLKSLREGDISATLRDVIEAGISVNENPRTSVNEKEQTPLDKLSPIARAEFDQLRAEKLSAAMTDAEALAALCNSALLHLAAKRSVAAPSSEAAAAPAIMPAASFRRPPAKAQTPPGEPEPVQPVAAPEKLTSEQNVERLHAAGLSPRAHMDRAVSPADDAAIVDMTT